MTKNSHKTGQGSVLVNNLKLQVGNFGMGLKVFGRSEVGLQWWDVGIEQGTRGRGEPDKDRAWFSLVDCRGGCFEVGTRLYGRGEMVLRQWNVGIEWCTRGRRVGGNPMKTKPLGLGFCSQFAGGGGPFQGGNGIVWKG